MYGLKEFMTRIAEFICLLGMFGVGYFVLLATG